MKNMILYYIILLLLLFTVVTPYHALILKVSSVCTMFTPHPHFSNLKTMIPQ